MVAFVTFVTTFWCGFLGNVWFIFVFVCPPSLGYVEGNTVQLKGRVACEINTCDELIATEMVFENVLESLDPPEIAGWC